MTQNSACGPLMQCGHDQPACICLPNHLCVKDCSGCVVTAAQWQCTRSSANHPVFNTPQQQAAAELLGRPKPSCVVLHGRRCTHGTVTAVADLNPDSRGSFQLKQPWLICAAWQPSPILLCLPVVCSCAAANEKMASGTHHESSAWASYQSLAPHEALSQVGLAVWADDAVPAGWRPHRTASSPCRSWTWQQQGREGWQGRMLP